MHTSAKWLAGAGSDIAGPGCENINKCCYVTYISHNCVFHNLKLDLYIIPVFNCKNCGSLQNLKVLRGLAAMKASQAIDHVIWKKM